MKEDLAHIDFGNIAGTVFDVFCIQPLYHIFQASGLKRHVIEVSLFHVGKSSVALGQVYQRLVTTVQPEPFLSEIRPITLFQAQDRAVKASVF
jgi:hypothetical protein